MLLQDTIATCVPSSGPSGPAYVCRQFPAHGPMPSHQRFLPVAHGTWLKLSRLDFKSVQGTRDCQPESRTFIHMCQVLADTRNNHKPLGGYWSVLPVGRPRAWFVPP